MALLDDAIDACGGLARWNSLSRFTLHLSVGGSLFSDAGHGREFKDVTAEGSTRTQSVRFTGITGGELSGAFQADAITIREPGWRGAAVLAISESRLPRQRHARAGGRTASGLLLRRPDLELSHDTVPPCPFPT